MIDEKPEFKYTSQACYSDEDMEALRRIRTHRRNTRREDPKAYESWTAQEEAIHDAALARYEALRSIPKDKIGDARAAREPFCPPAVAEEPPRLGAALSNVARQSNSLFKGVEGSAPWEAPAPSLPPPPMPAPWSAAPPKPDPTPMVAPGLFQERTIRRAVRKSKV